MEKHIRFDRKKVIKQFMQLIPDMHPMRNTENAVTTVTTYWKKGKLTRIEINGTDWTNYINRAKETMENILQMSKRYRKDYTGVVTLIATKKKGIIETLKYEQRNTIFRG